MTIGTISGEAQAITELGTLTDHTLFTVQTDTDSCAPADIMGWPAVRASMFSALAEQTTVHVCYDRAHLILSWERSALGTATTLRAATTRRR